MKPDNISELTDRLRRMINHSMIMWNAQNEYYYGISGRELGEDSQVILSEWRISGEIIINGKFVELKKVSS